MTSSIHTLIPDIQELLTREDKSWFTNELALSLSKDIANRMQLQFSKERNRPTLRLSAMGPKCPKALWHSLYTPEEAAPFPAWTEVKFAFGDITEALAIALAKASGHRVEGEQDELYVDGIKGHRDCVIDGCTVDIKSCSSIQYRKYKDGTVKNNDSFGFLDQLDGYSLASLSDPLVLVKDKAYIFAIDKTLGHMCLYEHEARHERIKERVKLYKRISALSSPPPCECGVVQFGGSGNEVLDTKASYSPFRFCCHPSLRTFLYSEGPKYFTKVRRTPDVVETDRHGRILH